ncbi:hypothetical protein BKA62DRAFT_24870 [Auriculariales sp. MPI-PUGE-AT-0066]|nr:hypothetical protein BKA62DRAFT_24870 [Auriculariales sp. MPI-PUGE-AT-0066]
MSSLERTPKRIKLDLSPSPDSADANDESDAEHCIICLQDIVDRTTLPNCAHERFCFECVVVWTEQSRKCPLCQQAMGAYLVHNARSLGSTKYFLPPLRSPPLPDRSAASSSQTVNRTIRQSRMRVWGQVEERRRDDAEERSLAKRKWVYEHDLYAKHVASNSHTKFRPYPTPAQLSAQEDLVRRTTVFVRRELRVWDNIDIDFVATFVVSVIKSIDIRAEASVKLLSEFLDAGQQPYLAGNRYRNSEHFAHEIYSYIRSPFRDLNIYDRYVQYDDAPDGSSPYGRFNRGRSSRSLRCHDTEPQRPSRPKHHVNESLYSRGYRPVSPAPLRGRRRSRSQSYSRSPSPVESSHRGQRRRSRSLYRSRSSPRPNYPDSRSRPSENSIQYRRPSRSRSPRSLSRSSPRQTPTRRSRSESRRSRSSHHSHSNSSSFRSRHQIQHEDQHVSSNEQAGNLPAHDGDAHSPTAPEVDSNAPTVVPVLEKRMRVPQRTPRQSALSSIRAHLSTRVDSTSHPLTARKRSLVERMADTPAVSVFPTSRVSSAERLDADEDQQNDDGGWQYGNAEPRPDAMLEFFQHQFLPPAQERPALAGTLSSREIMVRTRARLAALKREGPSPVSTVDDFSARSNTTPATLTPLELSPQAKAMRKILLAKVEEEKRNSTELHASVSVEEKSKHLPSATLDMEERRLRLKAKLSAAKRRASIAESPGTPATVATQ